MKFVLESKTNKDKSTELFPYLILKPTHIHTCNAESQNRSAKGYNLKEDDRVLPLLVLLLYAVISEGVYRREGKGCRASYFALEWYDEKD